MRLFCLLLIAFGLPLPAIAQNVNDETLAYLNVRRDVVSERLGVKEPIDRKRGYQLFIKLMADKLNQLPDLDAPPDTLGWLLWDEALAGQGKEVAKRCTGDLGRGMPDTPPNVGHLYSPTSKGRSTFPAAFIGMMDWCLLDESHSFYNDASCKLSRLNLRSDAVRVGCGYHQCADSGLQSTACVFDVDDRSGLPWMHGPGAQKQADSLTPSTPPPASAPPPAAPVEDPMLAQMRKSLDDPEIPEAQKIVLRTAIAQLEKELRQRAAKQKAAADFEPGELNRDVVRQINAAFAEEVGILRDQLMSGDDLALRYVARSYSADPEGFLKIPDSAQLLQKARDKLKTGDGRDIFDLVAATAPFGALSPDDGMIARAQEHALMCIEPETNSGFPLPSGEGGEMLLRAMADTTSGRFVRFREERVRVTPDPAGMASLTRGIVHRYAGAYAGPLSMIGRRHEYISDAAFEDERKWGREWLKLFLRPEFIFRALVTPALDRFGCSAAECAPGKFAVACVIPKIDTMGTLTRTPYPSLFNENPPEGWKNPR